MSKIAQWIWSGHWTAEDRSTPGVMLFRKEITITGPLKSAALKITADTRYKLYVNGKLVEFGPARGDHQVWFYDTVSLEKILVHGVNCIGVMVLRYPEEAPLGNHGMFRNAFPVFYAEGKLVYENGTEEDLISDASWKCKKDVRISFIREEVRFAPLIIHEKVYGDPFYRAWKMPGYHDGLWENAVPYAESKIPGAVSPGNLYPRPIPQLYRRKRRFKGVSCVRMSSHCKEDWEEFLAGQKELTIPAGTREIIEIDAGEEMTGFPHAAFEGGLGAKVQFTYAEAYQQNESAGPEMIPIKADRMDMKNGHLAGYSDLYYLYGQGNEERAENYLPYWFRTFRFIRLQIDTADEPLVFKKYNYEETGYPLDVKTHAEASDPSFGAIWEISERTLRRCMHETYEDCPYYEQLQYIMDARSQILYTYAVSGDDRLARSCIEAMKRGQRYDGLMNCSYPNCNTNVIPGFSIYYILMVYDHMMYFGDKALIRECMPAIENILNFFHRNLTPLGYVGKIGGLIDDRFWSFIDWATEWNDTFGVPTAICKGALTMESFLYIYGLQKAAALYEYMDRSEDARSLLWEASHVQQALLTYCMGNRGLFTDGPGIEEYSQHCQVFAILTHTGDTAANRENLLKTIETPSLYAQCTVAMRFYLFRAMEETGLYERTERYWDTWRRMIADHCTTSIESDSNPRSECHAWGALILYELPSVILGVRPAAPGYRRIRIHPTPGYLTAASGRVVTPFGMVEVSFKKLEDGTYKLEYTAPENAEIELNQYINNKKRI